MSDRSWSMTIWRSHFTADVPLQAQFMSDAEMVETQGKVLPLGVIILAHVVARVAARHFIRNRAGYGTALALQIVDYFQDEKTVEDAIEEYDRQRREQEENGSNSNTTTQPEVDDSSDDNSNNNTQVPYRPGYNGAGETQRGSSYAPRITGVPIRNVLEPTRIPIDRPNSCCVHIVE